MFFNQLEKRRIRDTYRQSLVDAIIHVEEGDVTYLHLAYCAFAFEDGELIRRGGRAARKLLEQYTMQKMLWLGEQFRQYTSLEWTIDWKYVRFDQIRKEFGNEKDYLYALILGSFHPNGYFREQCVSMMAECDSVLPYLILRMNDWVFNIRDRAKAAAEARAVCCPMAEIFYSAPALEKVKRSGRRCDKDIQEVEKLMVERAVRDVGTLPLDEIAEYEFSVRKAVYRLLFSARILDMGQADYLLDRERHSFCQSVMITGIFKYYGCSMEKIEAYLTHKNASVRRKALEYKYSILKCSWTGLEGMLLDTNHAIRELAAFILERQGGMNVSEFYFRHLADENPAVAIMGLGETGSREMADCLTKFLGHPSTSVVKNTILSISRLAGDQAADIYWKYLFDERVSVSKASCLAARNSGVRYGAALIYEEIKKSEAPHVRLYLMMLLLRENSWDRLPYLIELYQDERADAMHEKCLEAMWSRNVYAKVSHRQARVIENALEKGKGALPEELVKGILFDLGFVRDGNRI